MIRNSIKRFSGGSAKPHWGNPPKNRWQPFLLDRTYYGEHPTYNGFVLLLRSLRPKVEELIHSTYNGLSSYIYKVYNPLKNTITKHNPDIRYQFIAFITFIVTCRSITSYLGSLYQNIVDLDNLLILGLADDLNEHGFWNSKNEDNNQRKKLLEKDEKRLNNLWDTALNKAINTKSFDDFYSFILPKTYDVNSGIVPTISWRFNMIPYGNNNEDSMVFDVPKHDQPLRSLALNFTYNNISGNWGDYINRQDNKNALVRPSRQMFTDVYIPGTK